MRATSPRLLRHHRVVARAAQALRWALIAGLLALAPGVSTVRADESPPADDAPEAKKGKPKKKKTDSAAADGSTKLSARDVAFIVVQADFANVSVTIDGKPYPVNSEIGAVVTPGKLYEVVVTDQRSNTTARYQLQLARGEARVIMASLASSGPSAPVSRAPATPSAANLEKPAEPVSGEEQVAGAGYLTVNATPTAQVYIDGKLVASKTPLVKHKVEPGNHTVRVYYVDEKKFSETKRAMITEGRHVNLYFQNSTR